MKITKNYLQNLLDKTVKDFSQRVYLISTKVELEYIELDKFMADVKADKLIQQQISLGFYKNIDKEYPNFLVVYNKNKNPLLELFDLSFKISICLDKAKEILKPYTKQQVEAYLKHAFAHEIAHLVEDKVIKERQDLWQDCLKKTMNNEAMAMELLVEELADLISDKEEYEKVQNQIWGLIMNRMRKVKR